MPRGRLPTGIVATTALLAPSITVTSPERSFVVTTQYRPLGCVAGAAADANAVASPITTAADTGPISIAPHRRPVRMRPMIRDASAFATAPNPYIARRRRRSPTMPHAATIATDGSGTSNE